MEGPNWQGEGGWGRNKQERHTHFLGVPTDFLDV